VTDQRCGDEKRKTLEGEKKKRAEAKGRVYKKGWHEAAKRTNVCSNDAYAFFQEEQTVSMTISRR
jgi:hypothetical protein